MIQVKGVRMNKYEITTIVTTYNADWEQLKKTVLSAIRQRNVIQQIIISDDGSDNNYFCKLKELFKKYSFDNYILLDAQKNEGTCRNLYKALLKTQSQFFKAIAPGDYYFSDDILYKWLNKAVLLDSDVCFGETVCYQNLDTLKAVCIERAPQNVNIYDSSYEIKSAYLNYLFLDDAIFGCSILLKTDLMEKYLKNALCFLKYAEDMVYRIMIVDGIKVVHFNEPVVWYDYGTGISTNGSIRWAKIIDQEKKETVKYIIHNNKLKGFAKVRLEIGLNIIYGNKSKWLKYMIYPELIYWKIKKNKIKAYTSSKYSLDYIREL